MRAFGTSAWCAALLCGALACGEDDDGRAGGQGEGVTPFTPHGTEGAGEFDTVLTQSEDPVAAADGGTVLEPLLPPTGDEVPMADASPGDTGAQGEDTPAPAAALCFPGPARDGTACLPVVFEATPAADYAYPDALGGDANYRPPVAFIDLQAHDPATQLAPNFTLDELAQRRKGRFAVLQPVAIERLQALRDEVGPIRVTSAYRSPAYNATVGGATFSRHMYGDGFNLDPVEVPLATLEGLCTQQEGFLVQYETHVHCDFRDLPSDEVLFGPADKALHRSRAGFSARLERAGRVFTAPASGFDEGEPERTWRAIDANGEVCGQGRGRRFAAPACAHEVRVNVGAVLERRLPL